MEAIARAADSASDVSVVIPFYNRSSFARRLFDSIIGQTLKPAAVYVVDNGSTPAELDACRRVAASLDWQQIRPQFLETERRGNANVARNLGMQAASTRYVAFVDSDDWWDPSHLELSVRLLQATHRAAVYAGAKIHLDGVHVNESRDVNECASPFDVLFSEHSAQTSSYVVDLQRLGTGIRWDERLRRHQDYDFFLQVYYESSGWAFLPTPCTHIDWEQGGAGKAVDFRSKMRFRKKWEHRMPTEALRRYAYSQLLNCRRLGSHRLYMDYYKRLYVNSSAHRFASRLRCLDCYLEIQEWRHWTEQRIGRAVASALNAPNSPRGGR